MFGGCAKWSLLPMVGLSAADDGARVCRFGGRINFHPFMSLWGSSYSLGSASLLVTSPQFQDADTFKLAGTCRKRSGSR